MTTAPTPASEAAAALAAALHTGGSNGHATSLSSALGPASYCSVAVDLCDDMLCCSGNLLQAGPAHSSLVSAGASLAGVALRTGKPKLLLLRPLARRRYTLEDVRVLHSQLHTPVNALLCVPMLAPRRGGRDGGGGRAALGVLSVGFPSEQAVTAPVLQQCLLVAHALAQEQRRVLRDYTDTVGSMLLPGQLHSGTHSPSSGGWSGSSSGSSSGGSDYGGDNLDWEPGSEDSEYGGEGAVHGEEASGGGRGRVEAEGPAGAGPVPGTHPLTLQFRAQSCEQQFAAYHAAHLRKADGLSYLICLCFFCLEAVLPTGSPHGQQRWWWALPNCLALLPGLLLAFPRTRGWFTRHRDWMLFLTWGMVAGWTLVMRELCGVAPSDHSALAVLGLGLQMRFRFLAPFLLAVNTQMLPAHSVRQLLHSFLLPLACCYWFEAHTRRLFLLRSSAAVRVVRNVT